MFQFDLQRFGGGNGKGQKTLFAVLGFGIGLAFPGLFGLAGVAGGGLTAGLYGASIASTIWSVSNQKKVNTDSTAEFDSLQNTISSKETIPIIYGRRKWAGNQTWHDVNSDKTVLIKDIIIGEGEIDSISDVKLNDIDISTLSGCSYNFRNGAKNQSPPDNYSVVGGYKNCAWMRVTIAKSDDLNTGGNPTVTYVVKGLKVYDTRNSTTAWSDNPAMCVRDFLLNKRYGCGRWITADMLDEDSFKEVADYCDQSVYHYTSSVISSVTEIDNNISAIQSVIADEYGGENDELEAEILRLQRQRQEYINGQTSTLNLLTLEKRYSLNIIMNTQQSAIEQLGDMFACFGGFLTFTNNKISLRVERETTVSYAFNENTIIKDSVGFTQYSLDETPNQYNIKYIDPNQNWTQISVESNDFVSQKALGRIIPKEILLAGCISQSQALRLGQMYRDLNKLCSIIMNFSVATHAMHLEPGDVITATWGPFTNLPLRILEINQGNGIFTLKCRQYNGSIYTCGITSELQNKTYINIDSIYNSKVPQITDLLLSEYGWQNTDGTHQSNIDISFTKPTYKWDLSYSVGVSQDNVNYTYINNVKDIPIRIPVSKNGLWYVKVIPINNTGMSGISAVGNITLVGKDNPPSDVSNFTAAFDGSIFMFGWKMPTEIDVGKWEIRQGYSWDTGVTLDSNILQNKYTYTPRYNGTFSFWIKAIDNFGNYSENAKSAVISSSSLPQQNIIVTQNYNLNNAVLDGMYIDVFGNAQIKSIEKLSDNQLFCTMFNTTNTFVDEPHIEFPSIDIGNSNIDSSCYYYDPYNNMKIKSTELISSLTNFADIFNSTDTKVPLKELSKTYISVNSTYNQQVNYVLTKYQTSVNNSNFTDEINYVDGFFYGQYIKVILYPVCNYTLNLSQVKATIDVPDVSYSFKNINIPASKTTVYYEKYFWGAPTVFELFSYDSNGQLCIYKIENVTNTSFDITLLDLNGNIISGTIKSGTIRGY